MNNLLNWVLKQSVATQFDSPNWTRVIGVERDQPLFWNNLMSSKVLGIKFPKNFGPNMSLDLNNTVVLGGMCLLNTVEMKKIYNKEVVFHSVSEFESWFVSWYPRIDQIHDTVGVPPKMCQNILYVSEDSFFAQRLASYTGLDKNDIQVVLKKTHGCYGHKALVSYLKCLGYKGKVSVVYTSDVENELCLALKIWERLLGKTFRNCDRDFVKVEVMYSGFWLDILGIKSSAIIYEASSKMILKGWIGLDNWVKEQVYGTKLNSNLGVAGYLPFLTQQGDGSLLGNEMVPNRQNYLSFEISEENLFWYAVNLLFIKKTVIKNGPESIAPEKIKTMIKLDLQQYYADCN